jgi:hypothetical protein
VTAVSSPKAWRRVRFIRTHRNGNVAPSASGRGQRVTTPFSGGRAGQKKTPSFLRHESLL